MLTINLRNTLLFSFLIILAFSLTAQPPSYSGFSNRLSNVNFAVQGSASFESPLSNTLSNVNFTEQGSNSFESPLSNILANVNFELGYSAKSNILSRISFLPDFYFSKTDLDFGSVGLGDVAWQGLHLFNNGANPITVSQLTLANDGEKEFTLRSKNLPFSLPSKDSLYVSLKFLPVKVGDKTPKLKIVSTYKDSPQEIELTAAATIPAKPTLAVSLLEFGNTTLGTQVVKGITLKNVGQAALVIASTRLAGAGAAYFALQSPPAWPKTLNTNGTLALQIVFNPQRRGYQQATLILANADNSEQDTLTLTGIGVESTAALPKPSAPVAKVIASNGVRLTWAKVPQAVNYKLFRTGTVGSKRFTKQIYWSSVPAYTDRGNHLTAGATYAYQVQAENGAGFSALSEATAITLLTESEIKANPDLIPSKQVGLWLPYVKPARKSWILGRPETIDFKVHNRGNEDAKPYQVQFYLSEDQQITGRDIPMGAVQNFGALAKGQIISKTLTLDVPAINRGDYYIGSIIDPDNVNALNQNFGLSKFKVHVHSAVRSAPLPDLAFEGNQIMTGLEFTQGSTTILKTSILNIGSLASQTATDLRVYASTDRVLDKDDLLLATFDIPTLAPDEYLPTKDLEITFPTALSGDYYLISVTDEADILEESRESNNENMFPLAILIYPEGQINISGTITNVLGIGISGVELKGLPNNPITDDNGKYSVNVPAGWSGEIRPQKDAYFFGDNLGSQSYVVENATSFKIKNFKGIDTYDLVKRIKNATLMLSEAKILDLDQDLIKSIKTYDRIAGVIGEVTDYYKILTTEESSSSDLNQVIKGFKLMEKISTKTPLIGPILGSYFYLGVEIFKSVSNISDFIWARNKTINTFAALAGLHDFTVAIEIDKKGFLTGSHAGSNFDGYVTGKLMFYNIKSKAPRYAELEKVVKDDEIIFELKRTPYKLEQCCPELKTYIILEWREEYSSDLIRKMVIPLEKPFASLPFALTSVRDLDFEITLQTKGGYFSEEHIHSLKLKGK